MMALDGNALAGPLLQRFGREMTAAEGACAHCGTHSVVAELSVYAHAPGMVARCRSCGGVVMVVVTREEVTDVYLDGFRLAVDGRSA